VKQLARAPRNLAAVLTVVAMLVVLTGLGIPPASAATPTISSFSPQSGPDGSAVTIRGNGFMGTTDVMFKTTSATFDVVSNTRINATVPSGAQTGKISVTTPDGTASSTDDFVVTATADPSIDSFSPNSGPVGTSVKIDGTNFDGATAVKFHGTSATFTVDSSLRITADVPSGATTGPISVTTPDGTDTSTTNFTVTVPAPAISSFSPQSGTFGTSVTISGTALTGATSVKFDGTSATFTVESATRISATVPDGATTGPIAVTTPSGTGTSSEDFTIKHVRGITLSLSGHLSASGTVSVDDGTSACAATVAVKIQRRISHRWRVVGTTVTSGAGSYSLSIVDRHGKYRARAPRTRLPNGDVCVRATSSVVFNT